MRHWAFPDAAALLSSGVVVASASTLLLWAVPRADDFCYAATRLTWSEFVVQKYRTWAGRWLVMALYGAIWPAIDITTALYSVLLGILLVGLLASLVVLMRLAWGKGLPLATATAGALVLAALHLSAMPAPGESVFWLAGGAQYTLSVTLSILAVAALLRAARPPRSGAWSGLGFGLAVAVTGLNEAPGLTLLFVLLAIATLATLEGAPSAARWRLATLVVAIGCLVSVVAPGNAVRLTQDFGGGALSLAQITSTLTIQARHYLVPWVTDVRLVLASVLVLTSGSFGPPSWAQEGGTRRLYAVPVIAGVSTLIVFLLMAVHVGNPGPPRIYNYVHAVFLAAWLVSLAAWSGRLRLPAATGRTGALRVVAAVLLALSLLAAPNTLGYLTDLTGSQTARGFHQRMHSVYGELREARQAGVREVTIQALPKTPASFMEATIGSDVSHWQNRCVASFFGLERVASDPGKR